MVWDLKAICAGSAQPLRGNQLSAIGKLSREGEITIGRLGVEGDQQADMLHHGGPDMAVHLYPLAHHDFWREELGGHELLDSPGAFGSNLAVTGITEGDVLLGDRHRIGTALLEVCQPRRPCWKIEARFDRKGMVETILRTGRSGWYYRVIEEGVVRAGDRMTREADGLSQWPIAEVFEVAWGTARPTERDRLAQLADAPFLADKMRQFVRGRIAQG